MSQNLKQSTNSSLLPNEVENTISDSTIDSLEKDESSEQDEIQDFSSTKYSESEKTLPEQALEENSPMQHPSSNMSAEPNKSNEGRRPEYPRSNNTGYGPRYNRPRSDSSARFPENRSRSSSFGNSRGDSQDLNRPRSSSVDGVTHDNSRGDSQDLNGNARGQFAPRPRSFSSGQFAPRSGGFSSGRSAPRSRGSSSDRSSGGWSQRNRGFGGNSSRSEGRWGAPRNNFDRTPGYEDRTPRYENANMSNAVDANVSNDSQSSMAPTSSSRDYSRPRPYGDRRSSDRPMSNNRRFSNSSGEGAGFGQNRGGFDNRGGSSFPRTRSFNNDRNDNRYNNNDNRYNNGNKFGNNNQWNDRSNDAANSQQSVLRPYGEFKNIPNTGQENARDNTSSNNGNMSHDRNLAKPHHKEGRDFADYNIKSRQEEYKANPAKSQSDDQPNN